MISGETSLVIGHTLSEIGPQILIMCQLSSIQFKQPISPLQYQELMMSLFAFANRQIFSTLDFKNIYLQINERASNRQYTAFTCPYDAFQLRKITTETKNSAFTF